MRSWVTVAPICCGLGRFSEHLFAFLSLNVKTVGPAQLFKLALNLFCSSGRLWVCNFSALAPQAAGNCRPNPPCFQTTLQKVSEIWKQNKTPKTKIRQEDSSWSTALALVVFFSSLSQILTRVDVNIFSLSSAAPCNLVSPGSLLWNCSPWAVVVHAFSISTGEQKQTDLWVWGSLVYRVSSRTDKTVQRTPCLEKPNQNKQNEKKRNCS